MVTQGVSGAGARGEDLDWWERELGYELPAGRFGENLITRGLDLTGTLVGERWRVGGGVVLQATSPRIPYATFAHRMGGPDRAPRPGVQAPFPGLPHRGRAIPHRS